MGTSILTDYAISVSDLKTNPQKAVSGGKGAPVAVLNHNKPAFYCVPPELFEQWCDILDDLSLADEARKSLNEPSVSVSLDDL